MHLQDGAACPGSHVCVRGRTIGFISDCGPSEYSKGTVLPRGNVSLWAMDNEFRVRLGQASTPLLMVRIHIRASERERRMQRCLQMGRGPEK